MISVGDKMPSFSLTGVFSIEDPSKSFKAVSNEDNKGKWKIVFFWPKDFTFVCPTEISCFGDLDKEFKSRDAVILGVSTDSDFTHLAWKKSDPELEKLPFPMLSDIKKELSESLGILNKSEGVCQRATLIVDPENTVRFVYVTDLNVGRDPNEVLRVLDALQNGGLCPVRWKKGDKTLN